MISEEEERRYLCMPAIEKAYVIYTYFDDNGDFFYEVCKIVGWKVYGDHMELTPDDALPITADGIAFEMDIEYQRNTYSVGYYFPDSGELGELYYRGKIKYPSNLQEAVRLMREKSTTIKSK